MPPPYDRSLCSPIGIRDPNFGRIPTGYQIFQSHNSDGWAFGMVPHAMGMDFDY
jgi:hypothetical protein